MRGLVRLMVAVLFVGILLLGALAMIDNQQRVALRFLEWHTMELSFYWWLFLALFVGFVLGWTLAAFSSLRRRSVRQAKT